MRKLFYTALILLAAAGLAEKPKMAIYGFFSETFSRQEIVSLNSILESAMVDLGYFSILDRARLDVILKEKKLEDVGLIGTQESALKVGKLVGADYVVYGTVEKSFGEESKVTISVKVVDVNTGELVFAHSLTVDYAEVSDAIKKMVDSIEYENGKIVKVIKENTEIPEKRDESISTREKIWFSVGVWTLYYSYYDYLYRYQEQLLSLPTLAIGLKSGGDIVGGNVYLGVFWRRYFGIFYVEGGTIVLLLPYLDVGVSLGVLDLSYMVTTVFEDFLGGFKIALSFTF